jgi:site-specific recombinase XerD
MNMRNEVGTMPLDAWTLWMRAQGLSDRTIGERIGTVRGLLDFCQHGPLELDPVDIQTYLARPLSPATRATYHASIRAFTAWMQRTQVREDNPADRTPRPRRPKSRPRPIAPSQLEALLATVNRRRTRTYIMLAAYAGLRVHEIAKLHGRDLDPYTQVLTVLGKGRKVAQVPLHAELVEEAAHYPRDAYWFPAYSSQSTAPHVSATAVSQAISGAMERAGFHGKPHQLRHYYGTQLVRAGVNLRVVQTLMRHESPATTAIYTEVDLDQLRAGIAALNSAA